MILIVIYFMLLKSAFKTVKFQIYLITIQNRLKIAYLKTIK